MDSAGMSNRKQLAEGTIVPGETRFIDDSHNDVPRTNCETPIYTIDLSLPPVKRYQHVATDFKEQTAALLPLFDEIVLGMKPDAEVGRVRRIARLLLRRVYYDEETEELRGISEACGIELWLLVAYNVLLDLFMGCTSGAAKVDDGQGGKKMLHFRTLDWGMDPLRKVVVQLDFVEKPGGEVIASSITYVGYVGVLTGVRKGLSMSLNFRPNHDRSTWLANFQFYFHHILVLLGFRPSISSLLRQQLLPSQKLSRYSTAAKPTLESIERTLPSIGTTAAYLIFSDGNRTITMEKDHHAAIVISSRDFIVATNHDAAEETSPNSQSQSEPDSSNSLEATGMQGLVDDSMHRKALAKNLWNRSLRKTKRGTSHQELITKNTVVDWIGTYPISNEETHYATILDPMAGNVAWTERYTEPLAS
ncbi:hypothetical protein N7G274_009468 [Stereocaulon virgatum]|uniref:ceramidase n=1 Tax=Stereocaulon virgatum TaxID=373712 RepID=A0ABR3ZYB2_9LECA